MTEVSTTGARVDPDRFYATVLSEAEREAFDAALQVRGIDQEVAVLRVKLQTLLQKEKVTHSELLKALELLARSVAARFKLGGGSEAQLRDSLRTVLAETMALEDASDA